MKHPEDLGGNPHLVLPHTDEHINDEHTEYAMGTKWTTHDEAQVHRRSTITPKTMLHAGEGDESTAT